MSDTWNELTTVLEQARQARANQDQSRAHTLYVRATQLDPKNASAWTGRAAVALDSDDALLSWGRALSIAPQDQEARVMLSRRIQERIGRSTAGDSQDLLALGRDLAKAGQKSFAYQLFKRATELVDRNDQAWVWRAGCTDSAPEAIAYLNRALALNPNNVSASSGLRWILGQQFSNITVTTESAAQAAKQVTEGRRLYKLGDKSRAYEFFRRAIELDHRNESAWLWRGSTTNSVDEALMCMEQALIIDPENRDAQDARQWLRTRKLQTQAPAPSPPRRPRWAASSPVPTPPPVPLPIEQREPVSRTRILLLAISVILLILLVVNFLQSSGYLP